MWSGCELVALRGGLVVSKAACDIFFDLESRGITLDLVDDTDLLVAPASLLTDADRVAIRAHKAGVVALVRYCDNPPLPAWPA